MDSMASTAVQLAVTHSLPGSSAGVVPGEGTDRYVTAAHVSWIAGIAVAALISGICSYYFVVSGLVDVMSVLVVVLGPTVAVQKVKLTQLGSFRQIHNELRQNVNGLHQENQKLTASVDALTTQNVKLDRVQQDLQQVAQKSGASVDQLVSIVQENGQVQKEILQLLHAQVLEQIMTAVLATDADRDFVVDPPEVEILIVRLKNMPGMEFDEAAFRALLRQTEPPDTLTLPDVLAMARQLQDQTQTMVQSTVCRRDIFAPSPRNKNSAASLSSPKSHLLSPSFQKSGGTLKHSPRAAMSHVFGFKPRSLLKNKKLLGIF